VTRHAGVFTKNRVKAASVVMGMAKVKTGKGRIIVANSGCANACTGKQGILDARETAEIAAKEFGAKPEAVYVASTGVIGETLPLPKIRTGSPRQRGSSRRRVGARLPSHYDHGHLSQDRRRTGGDRRKTITLAGITKGSGMIHPNMATMLCFIVTDALIARRCSGKC